MTTHQRVKAHQGGGHLQGLQDQEGELNHHQEFLQELRV